MALIRKQRGLMAKIASELGITRAAVAMWKEIPADRVPDVERITGIPRHELRPSLWQKPARRQQAARS